PPTHTSLISRAADTLCGTPFPTRRSSDLALTGSAAGNYSAPTFTGTPALTINAASLTGSIVNQSKTYGSDDPSLSGIAVTLTGIISSTHSSTTVNETVNITCHASTNHPSL